MGKTRVSFIKLKKPEKARHLCELAERFLEQGERVLITVNDENQGVTLDQFMWTWKKGSFVPHCFDNGAVDCMDSSCDVHYCCEPNVYMYGAPFDNPESHCADGLDNDCDTYIDCDDADCEDSDVCAL